MVFFLLEGDWEMGKTIKNAIESKVRSIAIEYSGWAGRDKGFSKEGNVQENDLALLVSLEAKKQREESLIASCIYMKKGGFVCRSLCS